MTYVLRSYDGSGELLVSSHHQTPYEAGEQAARRSHVAHEWARPLTPVFITHVLRIKEGSAVEREATEAEHEQMYKGMEAVEEQISREIEEKYG